MRPQRDPVGAGQESVWDYPRPPRVERVDRRVRIELGGRPIVDTADVVRVLETSHPPVYYLPIPAFADGALTSGAGSSYCEFKGGARYFDVRGGDEVRPRAAWTYPDPRPGFEELVGRVAVYAQGMDACSVDGVPVVPQPGTFYGGWITPEIVGPFKGVRGSMGW
ncbi:DUF427 domain-containing protein [Microbacterium sp. M3]|uniref:DUF427 domain-containing protein n=1 Tax=Microbacterium arthrosphaerae TaxID=792652 RepID=A0ABU4GWZ7_9MICO|nr:MULTISPECIES: DUF427 domain-containing protein [Microbacterium]MDW4571600.1 DUF427 domain-containing protein [Microbacterium arthrosphaerae]MDW7605455.1 DUF427 domain-containing protein [Microbacterium sp. M3]